MADDPRFPAQEPPIEPTTGLFKQSLLTWFRDLRNKVNAVPAQVAGGKVVLQDQTDSIGTTPFPTGTLAAGLYRVSWDLQVMTAAGVSSSTQVTISWTDNGVTQTKTGALVNGNSTTTHDVDGVMLLHIDGGTPISYAVAYTSTPANGMIYSLALVLEAVSLD